MASLDPDAVSQTAPATYNLHETISAYPDAMYEPATVTIPTMLSVVGDAFTTIDNIWQELKLSWVGNAASGAEEFNDKLQSVQQRLFGASVQPVGDVSGVVGKYAGAAAMAAENYENAEQTNTKMFNDLYDSIGSSSDTPSTSPSTDAPITESFPGNVPQ